MHLQFSLAFEFIFKYYHFSIHLLLKIILLLQKMFYCCFNKTCFICCHFSCFYDFVGAFLTNSCYFNPFVDLHKERTCVPYVSGCWAKMAWSTKVAVNTGHKEAKIRFLGTFCLLYSFHLDILSFAFMASTAGGERRGLLLLKGIE